MGSALGNPMVLIAMHIFALDKTAKPSMTFRQRLELEERGELMPEFLPLDEQNCRELFEMARAGSVDADVVLRQIVRQRVGAVRMSPVLAEYVAWALSDDTVRPDKKSLKRRDLEIVRAVAWLASHGFKPHAKRGGYWIVATALGELRAEGKLDRDLSIGNTSAANIEKICRGAPLLAEFKKVKSNSLVKARNIAPK